MAGAIDLQHSVLQAPAADKVQQAHQQHPDMQQRYFSLQMNEDRKLRKEKINRSDDAEKALIRDGNRKRNPRDRQALRKVDGAEEMPSEDEESGHGGRINITV